MNVLVLGGTVFVGRHIVAAALARGHRVTIFHRGQHGEDAHPDVEHIHGDRTVDLHLLARRHWDAVLDTCGFDGPTVAASAALLADSVAHYGFVSSVSAYRDWPATRIDETSVVKEPGSEEDDYGAGKVAAEDAVEAAIPGRVLISRPGLIVGPHENIGRLPHWLRRLARGGEVLAPGSPDEWRQWVDARDLAEFHIRAAEDGRAGVFNTVGLPTQFTMGQLLAECRAVAGSSAELIWVDGATITRAGISPWTELPIWLWSAEDDVSHTWDVDAKPAYANGLVTRDWQETVRDTWTWMHDGLVSDYRNQLAVRDLDPARERAALMGARDQRGGSSTTRP